MNAVKLLKADHKHVRGLFREFEGAGERAYKKRESLVQQVLQELTVHTKIEQEIFYPACEAKGKELKEMIAEGLQEHHVVDLLMQELRGMAPDDDQYEAKFTVLMENVEHHIEEEEKELFPKAEDKLGKQMDELGAQMEQRKQALMEEAGRREAERVRSARQAEREAVVEREDEGVWAGIGEEPRK